MAIIFLFRPLSDADVQGLEVGQVLINRLKQPVVVLVVDGHDILVAEGVGPCGFEHSYVRLVRGAIVDRACTPWAHHNGIITQWRTARDLSFPREFRRPGC